MRRVAITVPREEHKLLRAVAGGDHRLVEEYLEEEEDFTVTTSTGHTALHIASARGLANVLRVLLVVPEIVEHKDDTDNEGRTALCLAAANGEVVRIDLLECHLDCNLELGMHRLAPGMWSEPSRCCSQWRDGTALGTRGCMGSRS